MKKQTKTFVIVVAVLITLTLGGLYIYNMLLKPQNIDEENQDRIMVWVDEHILNSEAYQFDCTVDVSIDAITNETQRGTLTNIRELYHITVLNTDKMIRIEKIQTMRYYYDPDTTDYLIDTYTDQIYYIAVKDNAVLYYELTDMGYVVQTFEGTDIADAFSALFFPVNFDFIWDGEPPMSGGLLLQDDEIQTFTYRKAISTPFYEPFRLISNDEPFNEERVYVGFTLHDEPYVFGSISTIILNDIDAYFDYAAEALSGKPAEHPYDKSSEFFDRYALLHFSEDLHNVEKFDLPNID